MPRSFDISGLSASFRGNNWKEPRIMMRVVLGVLLAGNLIAAAFAFHLFSASPEELRRQVESVAASVNAARARLTMTRQIVGKVQLARTEGDQFLTSYMTPRRTTYSAIVSELQLAAENAQMSWKEGTIAP